MLCWPRGDLRRSTEHLASRWLLDVVGARTGARVWSHDLLQLRAPWIEHVPSFGAGVARHRLPGHGAGAPPARRCSTAGALAADPAFDRGARLLRARRSPHFTEYDGNLDGWPVPSPAAPDQLVSTTRLEAWAACPLHYFFRFVLGVADVENPEDVLRLSPLDKGSLLHATLDRFLQRGPRPARRRSSRRPPIRGGRTTAERLAELFDEEAVRYVARGLTGRDLFWRQDRRALLRDLHILLRNDGTRRRAAGRPPVRHRAPLRLRRRPGGRRPRRRPLPSASGAWSTASTAPTAATSLVIDYKTGRSDAYRNLGESEPTAGRHPAAAPGLRAGRPGGRRPRPTPRRRPSTGSSRPAASSSQPLGPAHRRPCSSRSRADIAAIVDGIEAGCFPAHPHRPVWQFGPGCLACDGDGAGTAERWHEWTRKKDAPEMAEYLALAARQGADRG